MLKLHTDIKYSVCKHPIVVGGCEVTEYLIVTRDRNGFIIDYTGLEFFAQKFTGRRPVQVKRDSQSVYIICRALNDIFAYNCVRHITDITLDMLIDFVERYATEPYDETGTKVRGQQAVDKCIAAVSAFFANLILCYPDCFSIPVEDLFHPEYHARRNSKHDIKVMVPTIRMKSLDHSDSTLYRDLTAQGAHLLIETAKKHDPMIAFGIGLGIYGGLRGGEIVNVRQENSPISAIRGIKFEMLGDPSDNISGRSSITAMRIDLRELPLRSDGTIVGRVKRTRTVDIYHEYIHPLYDLYRNHLELLKQFEHNEEYLRFRPMFVLRNGKAMTQRTFFRRFVRLILDHFVPNLLEQKDERMVAIGHHLNNGHFGTHILRHSFSATLACANGMTSAQLMYYRGDRSPTSSIPYMSNKQDVVNMEHAVHDDVLGRMVGHKRREQTL